MNFVLISGGSQYGHPIHTTENMPDNIVGYGAIAGFIFLALILYSHYKSKEKRKFKSFKYNDDRHYDNDSNPHQRGL